MNLLKERHQEISDFCRRWRIRELSIFGSAARGDIGPNSDVDVLVSFDDGVSYGLWDHAAMRDDLSAILGRAVDLFSRRSVEKSRNWIRRNSILNTAVPIYAAR